MKRYILVVLVMLAFFGLQSDVYGQTNNPVDIVLLLDTSSGMSSSYENVNNYITGAFLSEFLRVGDTFHLIAFSERPRLDAARRISGVGDVETIIGRILLQYPVERGNNVGAALTYAEQYIVSLPNRPKKIVLVSVGAADTNSLVSASRQRLSARNTTLDFIQVTPGQRLTNLPSSGRPPAARRTTTTTAVTSTTTTGMPDATGGTTIGGMPGATGTPGGVPGAASGITDGTTFSETHPISSTDERIAQTSEQSDWRYEYNEYEDSTSALVPAKLTESEPLVIPFPLIIAIILGLLLLLGLILLLSSRKLGSSPNRVMAEVASSSSGTGRAAPREQERFKDHSKDLNSYVQGSSRRTTPYDDRPVKNAPPVINPAGPLLLNLFVEDQNTAIGKRNIHSLKSGYGLSIGGSKADDFLIFLVPIPGNIGEIRRNGSSLSFVPRKPKYFPDIGSNEVRDCINKTIRVVSDKNYEMRFRFEMYEDPLVVLNRMLMSVKVPG